jgi:hypothetical protein
MWLDASRLAKDAFRTGVLQTFQQPKPLTGTMIGTFRIVPEHVGESSVISSVGPSQG